MSADPMLVAKSLIGLVYVEEKLLCHRTKEKIWYAARADLRSFNTWYCNRQRLKGDVRGLNGETIRASVYKDLRSPAFRKKLWDSSHDFDRRVVGQGPDSTFPAVERLGSISSA